MSESECEVPVTRSNSQKRPRLNFSDTESATDDDFVHVTYTLQHVTLINSARYTRYTRYIFLKYLLNNLKNM